MNIKKKADVSSTKFISEEAPRGNIYDSNGNVIATNKQTYALTYMETLESKRLLQNYGQDFQNIRGKWRRITR